MSVEVKAMNPEIVTAQRHFRCHGRGLHAQGAPRVAAGGGLLRPGLQRATQGVLLGAQSTESERESKKVFCSSEPRLFLSDTSRISLGIQGISSGLAKRLGGQRVKEALKMLDEDRWSEAGLCVVFDFPDRVLFHGVFCVSLALFLVSDKVASMMLEYYDKLYERWADESLSARINVEC